MKQVLILGAGGTGADAADIIAALNTAGTDIDCLGYLDDAPAKQGTSLHGLPVLGSLRDAASHDAWFVDCLGSPRSFRERRARIEATGIPSDRFLTLVHPSAVVSPSATLGSGCLLYPHVVVGAGARLGDHVTVLAHTVIHHDSVVGPYSILASGVIVSGGVTIGAECYLGAGCSLRDGARLGSRSLVGMGSTVTSDVAADATVVGTPARPLER